MDRDLKRARMLISLVHDGQLTDEEYRFLERAVLRYPELQLEIYRHERLHDLMGTIASVSAPPGIENGVMEAIRSEGVLKRAARIIFFPGRKFSVEAAGAIAASIIVVFIALISFPSLVGTDKEAAVLNHDTLGALTASVAMGESPPTVADKTRPPAEDVAVIPRASDNGPDDRLEPGGIDEERLSAPETEKKTFSSELPSTGMLTAAGVTAEKVSKTFIPARTAPLSTAKKEVPMGSTAYIYSPSDDELPPIILLIYNNDPTKTKNDIMDKAVSLGGTMTSEATEDAMGEDTDVSGTDMKYKEEAAKSGAVSLPAEKMDELLDYLAARYPETDEVVKGLKKSKTTLFIRIDVVPTIQ